MTDSLTYAQRFKLGAIRVRRDCADNARRRATDASLRNDFLVSEMLHAEADHHETEIMLALHEFWAAKVISATPVSQPVRRVS
jgi:hypothetical protein